MRLIFVFSALIRLRNKIRRPDACSQIASAYFPKDALCLIQTLRNDELSDKRKMFQSPESSSLRGLHIKLTVYYESIVQAEAN